MNQVENIRSNYRIYSLTSRTFLPGIWPVFCLRLIHATYPEGQSFRMSYHRISVIQSNRKCHLAMGESRALSCLSKFDINSRDKIVQTSMLDTDTGKLFLCIDSYNILI